MSEKHTWDILGNHFKKHGFVSHQTESFNYFLETGIPNIITEEPDIIIFPESEDSRFKNYRVNFSDIHIPHPTVIKANSELRGPYPSEARQRDLTYDSPIYATVTETIELDEGEKEGNKHKREILSNIKRMLRSTKCYLSNMNKEERVKAGECEFDEGGYFIVKGKERVLVAQLRGVYNIPMVLEQKQGQKYKYITEMRSMSNETGHSVVVRAQIGEDDRTLQFELPYIKEPVPIGIVFKAMGYKSSDIAGLIGLDCEIVEKYIRIILNDSFVVEEMEDGYNYFMETNGNNMALDDLRNAWDDMDDDESANHGFRVKGDVPCQLANHAGFDAVDGQ